MFNGLIEHLLQGSIDMLRHFCEAAVRRGTDADCGWHTKMYALTYAQLSTNGRTTHRQWSVEPPKAGQHSTLNCQLPTLSLLNHFLELRTEQVYLSTHQVATEHNMKPVSLLHFRDNAILKTVAFGVAARFGRLRLSLNSRYAFDLPLQAHVRKIRVSRFLQAHRPGVNVAS